MFDLIEGLYKVLNMVKDFGAGYCASTAWHGYMLLKYKGKKYAVKIVEMNEADQNNDGFEAIDNVPYYFNDQLSIR